MPGGVFGQQGHAQLCASRDLTCALKHALQSAQHSDDGSHIAALKTVLGHVRAKAQDLELGQSARAKQQAQDGVLLRYVGEIMRFCQHTDPILPAGELQRLASQAEVDFQTTPAYLDKQIEYSRGGCASSGHVGKDDETTKLVLGVLRRFLDAAARMSESERRRRGVSLYPDFGAQLPHLHRRHLHSAPTAVWQVAQRWLEAALIKAKEMLPDLSDEELRAVFDAERGRCAFVGADGLHTERTTMRGGNPLPPLASVWYNVVVAAFLFISRPCCEGCEAFMAGNGIDVIALVAFANVQDMRPERRGRPAMHFLSWDGGVRRELVEGSGWVATPAPAPPSARKQAAGSSGPQKRQRPRASGGSMPPRRKRRVLGRDEPGDEEDVEAEAATSEGEAEDNEDDEDEDEDEWEEDDDVPHGWGELQGDYLAGGSEEPPRTTSLDRRKRGCGCRGGECDACDIVAISGDEQLIEQALLQEAERLRCLVKDAAAAAGVRTPSLFFVKSVGASRMWLTGAEGVWLRHVAEFNAAATSWLASPEVVEALAAQEREREEHAAHVQEALRLQPIIERACAALGLAQGQLADQLEPASPQWTVSMWQSLEAPDSRWKGTTAALATLNDALRGWAERQDAAVEDALKAESLKAQSGKEQVDENRRLRPLVADLIRERGGMQKQLAVKLNIDERYLSLWMQGKVEIRDDSTYGVNRTLPPDQLAPLNTKLSGWLIEEQSAKAIAASQAAAATSAAASAAAEMERAAYVAEALRLQPIVERARAALGLSQGELGEQLVPAQTCFQIRAWSGIQADGSSSHGDKIELASLNAALRVWLELKEAAVADALESQSGEQQQWAQQEAENHRLSELVAGTLHTLAMSKAALCRTLGLDKCDFDRWMNGGRDGRAITHTKLGPLNAKLCEWQAHQTCTPTPMKWRKNAWKPQSR